MKNVTVTMDEAVARWARVEAAKRDLSLARFIGDVLRTQMEADLEYARAMKAFLRVEPSGGSGGRGLPTREEIHDRAALRR